MQRGTGMALFAMGLGVLVIANDFTALNVALPAIEEDFDADVGTIQWTVNAYALTFGMVLVTGGRLADMFGRRKVFFIGTAIFAGFSLLGALAPNAEQLIAMRVGMGVGGGLMWPAILGMTFAAVPAERAAFAGGLILGVAGLGNALGPLHRRPAHRRAELAGDLLAQPADRGVRGGGHLGEDPPAPRRLGPRADRLRGDRLALARAGPAAAGARPVGGLGADRPAGARDGRRRRRSRSSPSP